MANVLISVHGKWQVRLHVNPKAQQYALYCNGDYFAIIGANGTTEDLAECEQLAAQYATGNYAGLTKTEIKQIARQLERDVKYQQFPL